MDGVQPSPAIDELLVLAHEVTNLDLLQPVGLQGLSQLLFHGTLHLDFLGEIIDQTLVQAALGRPHVMSLLGQESLL